MRFGVDGPTAALLALVESRAEPDAVELAWAGAGAGTIAAWVERTTEGAAWTTIGAPTTDGEDRLRFVDRSVTPGARYGYRLGYRDGGLELFTDETWVDVPSAHTLGLEGFVPNPAVGSPTVRFALPNASPATLELLDIAGRRLSSRRVGSLGPGRHAIRLDREPRLSPGIYLLRLRTQERTLVTRAAVLR